MNDILQQMVVLLSELAKIDFGYPLEDNVVRINSVDGGRRKLLASSGGCARKWLTELYSACDGLDFPDVHVGYFIKPLGKLISFDRSSEPESILLDRVIPIIPIGSNGGGNLFVVDCDRGSVLMLPPGPMRNGQYDGRGANVREVAPTVIAFFEFLLNDLRAFVDGDEKHKYISNT